MASFANLNLTKPILRALEDLGFNSPTPIQEKAYPVIMGGRDVVGIAQTGTGKTLAYLLPLLKQHTYSEQRHPRVVILVPTRELVVQVADEIAKLSSYMSIRVLPIYGASNINTQKQKAYDGQDVVVATPGRLMDLVLTRTLQLSAVKKLVVDEVDEMLNLGFRGQITQILELLPARRQNILFSATLSEEVEKIIKSYFNDPEYVELIARGTPLQNILQQGYHVPNFYSKVNLLRWMLQYEKHLDKVLVFVKNKDIAGHLENEMIDFADQMGVIHSNKTQPHRFEKVRFFNEGKIRLLIATDVIARGIDFQNVSHVINFDFPKEPGTYVHRIGRTGRADKSGTALSFITDKEKLLVEKAEELMSRSIEILSLPEDVELSENLLAEEIPGVKDKNLQKARKIETPTGAFHEKKAKNRKEQLGGKRRQEKLRRALEKSRSKRNR